MNVQSSAVAVAFFGLATTLVLVVGFDSVGGVMALIQLCLLVGAPLAVVLHAEVVRSWPVATVLSVALSIAISAIAVQILIWFRIATSELLVMTATAYGVVLALLLAAAERQDGGFGALAGRGGRGAGTARGGARR